MTFHLTDNRAGFGQGLTQVTRHDEANQNTGISFGVLRLKAGETWRATPTGETAYLLMAGTATLAAAGREETWSRRSLFDESPSCLHVPAGEAVTIKAKTECELTLYATANAKRFPVRWFAAADTANEPRGKGQVGGACLRFVRTIFDRRNSPDDVELVLGEVITMPGRWSSYPPHHHPQPEIYHYRFTDPRGFGHAELGDTVLKVRHNDTVKIFDGFDHPQCAAPGYGMYYAWVIRHLPEAPYIVPEFTAEHAWTMEKDARFWWPAEIAPYG
jgi:5-deoxy-glucuronate isomerase